MRNLTAILAGIMLLACTFAHAQYAWIDPAGVRQFSDRPPPVDTPASKILKAPAAAGAAPAEQSPQKIALEHELQRLGKTLATSPGATAPPQAMASGSALTHGSYAAHRACRKAVEAREIADVERRQRAGLMGSKASPGHPAEEMTTKEQAELLHRMIVGTQACP